MYFATQFIMTTGSYRGIVYYFTYKSPTHFLYFVLTRALNDHVNKCYCLLKEWVCRTRHRASRTARLCGTTRRRGTALSCERRYCSSCVRVGSNSSPPSRTGSAGNRNCSCYSFDIRRYQYFQNFYLIQFPVSPEWDVWIKLNLGDVWRTKCCYFKCFFKNKGTHPLILFVAAHKNCNLKIWT